MATKAATAAVMLLRRTTNLHHRALSTQAPKKPYKHHDHNQDHPYLEPTPFIGSFIRDDPPKNPKEAIRKLALLRRDYNNQIKVIRKKLIEEAELKRLEKARKDEARTAELQRQKVERRKLKAAAAAARAVDRKVVEDELRATLAKERAERLEYWRKKQNAIEQKKKKKREFIREQSGRWVKEEKLEPRILEAICDSQVL